MKTFNVKDQVSTPKGVGTIVSISGSQATVEFSGPPVKKEKFSIATLNKVERTTDDNSTN